MKKNILYDKAFAFSVRIVKLNKYLCSKKKEYTLSNQILRSGTSVAANIKESEYAQTKKDFVAKLSISLKEAGETEYWIDLLRETGYLEDKAGKSLLDDLTELMKILMSSIKTAKRAMKNV